jgi:hypothetical protein
MACQVAAALVHLTMPDTRVVAATIRDLSLLCRYNNKTVPSALEILYRMILRFIQWGLELLVLIIQDYQGQTPRIATRRRLLVGVTPIIKVTSTAEFTTNRESQGLELELEGDTLLIINTNRINIINLWGDSQ